MSDELVLDIFHREDNCYIVIPTFPKLKEGEYQEVNGTYVYGFSGIVNYLLNLYINDQKCSFRQLGLSPPEVSLIHRLNNTLTEKAELESKLEDQELEEADHHD